MNKLGIFPAFQVHDEASYCLLEKNKEKNTELLKLAIKNVNEELKLNVQIGASIDYGFNYKQCH